MSRLNFNKAFLEAQKGFTAALRAARNDYAKYNYATLETIYDAVMPSLHKHGLFIEHCCKIIHEEEWLYTAIVHAETDERHEDMRKIVSEKAGAQARGAAETYAKKYAVLSLCAVPATDDDDQAEEQLYILLRDTIAKRADKDKVLEAMRKRFRCNQLSELTYKQLQELEQLLRK